MTDSLRAHQLDQRSIVSATFGFSQQDRLAKYVTGVITLLKRPCALVTSAEQGPSPLESAILG
jgi:hypothetical protein